MIFIIRGGGGRRNNILKIPMAFYYEFINIPIGHLDPTVRGTQGILGDGSAREHDNRNFLYTLLLQGVNAYIYR